MQCDMMIEGSLEVKLPTIWTDEKQRWEESEKRRGEERRSKKRSLRRKKIQVREKVAKSRNIVFFQWFVAPEGRKVGSLKRRVRSQQNCTLLWREARLQVKKLKTPHVRSTFGSWDVEKVHSVVGRSAFASKLKTPHVRTTLGSCDVEKVHAVVARSTFRSQNAQNTPFLDHFWKLRFRKRARRWGAKRRSTFRSQHVRNTRGSDHFWKLRCLESGRRCGAKHISKAKCAKQF